VSISTAGAVDGNVGTGIDEWAFADGMVIVGGTLCAMDGDDIHVS
jgi:hypothetical protein